ncbi:MAG: SUMF1/EgtB/PvdO family nonheme iron enzyme [bacterium]|nr:SUMF1/EgtB/PvdO family nonheme iron enzyme [bacterium]
MKQLILLAGASLLLALQAARAGQPSVTNVTAQQLPNSEIIQISYDLAEDEGLACWVSVQVDRDNLGSWAVPVHALTGDVGPNVQPGGGKTIQWNAALDYDHNVANAQVRVTAHSLVDGAPQDMVLVPAGEFVMGSSAVGGDAVPEHTVYLDAYWIDIYEVTNREYKLFCDATSRAYPPDPGFSGMSGYFLNYPQYPVVNVYWADAMAYATWAGKRLPTEAEWERAAKGNTDNRLWPWGNVFNANIGGTIHHANTSVTGDGFTYTAPDGNYPTGTSPVGCMDMAGNVWEWCSDWYSSSYYSSSPYLNPQGSVSGTYRVRRGGYWSSYSSYARCAYRSSDTPTNRTYNIGFRCARTL